MLEKYVYIQLYHYIKNIQFSVKREVFAWRVTIICLTEHNLDDITQDCSNIPLYT